MFYTFFNILGGLRILEYMSIKTNAVRILDQQKISYELREYDPDDSDLSALHVAAELGIEAGAIFKTLVLKGNLTGYLVAVVPGDTQLDLKKIAKASGNKSCEMIPVKELLQLTGYIRGGCSPIGMKKLFPTYIEEAAILQDKMSVSGGRRGLQIIINPQDLKGLIAGTFADLIS